MIKINYLVLLLLLFFISCNNDDEKIEETENYLTENVFIIVMDGARYSETWGDKNHQFIPRISNQLSYKGVVNTNFFNNGPTYTVSGHTALTTGNYQTIDNGGSETPDYPSIFQYWLKEKNENSNKAWIISSKDKLEVLTNCEDPEWNNTYNPSSDCGVNGLGSGYREDIITFENTKDILTEFHPKLTLINLKQPDSYGHSGVWEDYLQGILDSDEYIYQLFEFINNDETYSGKTAIFITNDHGRHLDNVANGFKSHGDDCLGCRHIIFFANGPDFKQNIILNEERELIDIPSTIAVLLDFTIPNVNGNVMIELFK